jgi:uncharacterized protein YbjT (DUF2867 family)
MEKLKMSDSTPLAGKRILVYGATGSQAGPIPWKLLEKGAIPRILTRNPAKADKLQAAGAEIAVGDLNDSTSLAAANAGIDAVALLIPAFGGNPMDAPRLMQNAVNAARTAGVKLMVWNSSGPMIEERTGFPMYDLRFDMAEMLRQSDVPSVIIQPTVYLENLLGPWTQPNIAEHNELTYPVAADARLGWIASADVAAFVVAALERPQLAGRKIVVSGVKNLNGPELAQAVSEGLGRKIAYRAMPLEEFGAALDKAFGPGAGQGGIAGYKFQEENRDRIVTWVEMAPVLEKLPVQMTSVSQWAVAFAPAFSPMEAQQ